MKKYYYAGGTRVAERTGSNTLNFLLGDHLGSTALTTDSSGVKSAEIRYYPWGTTRYTSGTIPTTFRFTGQRIETSFGLYYYGARWYDAAAGRFVQPDMLIPQQQGVQAWDRFAYTSNNPVKYTDPTGHRNCEDDGYCPVDQTTTTTLTVAPATASVPVSTQSAMQTQANSPFTLMTQIAYTPGSWIGAASTETPTLPTTSTSTPIPQGQRIETYNNALTGIDILRGGWNYFSQHIDIAAPNPIIGFVRGAYVQATQDIDSGNFIGPEILLRSGVSGLEGAATDVVSTGGGLAGGGAGLVACSGLPICGSVGYIIGAGSTYVAVDNAFNQVNERWLFPFIHNAVNGD